MENVFHRRRGKVDAHVGPAGIAVDTTGEVLDIPRFAAEAVDESLTARSQGRVRPEKQRLRVFADSSAMANWWPKPVW